MAQTLEDFLISVKYQIDAPSQQTFFDAMKRAATSVAGVAGELTGLGLAVMKVADIMAQSGEKLYWMSQRLGDSVADIQGLAYAMSGLGESADQATAGIERFGAWTRSMGPAASGYLRALGVTATDTVGRMRQLGEYFRTHGGTQAEQGTLEYALTLRRAQMMGIDEQTMLAASSGRLEQNLQQAGLMQRLVWGRDWQAGPQRFATQSVAVMNQFRQMGFFFQNLSQQFGLGLFNAILPQLEKINLLLIDMLPAIQRFLNHLISYAPAALEFLQGMMHGFKVMLEIATFGMETFDKLPAAMQHAVEAMLLFPAALKLMGSPLFWILGGLTALLLLLDDYQHYEDDLKHPGEKKTAYFDWGKIGDAFKPVGEALKPFQEIYDNVMKITREFNNWAEKLGMSKTAMEAIEAAVALIAGRYLLMRGVGAIAGVFGGLGLGSAVPAIAALTVGTLVVTGAFKALEDWLQKHGYVYTDDQLKDRAKQPQGWPWWLPSWLAPPGAIQEDAPDWFKGHSGPPNIPKTGPVFGPQQHGSLGMGGRYQLASTGWMGSGGEDSFYTAERFYVLFRDGFASANDKLGTIIDTLSDMAEGQGAPHTARGGGGGDADLLGPGAGSDEQEARLRLIEQRESGGQNINNRQGPGGSPASSASGYYQMIDSTWEHAAKLAGINTLHYPRAIDAPWDVQHRAALALINEQGERPWISSAPHHLSHQPLGVDGGDAPGWAGRALSRQHGNIHNETNIQVVAPSPASAAAQVAEHQIRIHEHHVRFAAGRLLA
jgi:hypothetical protein